MSKKFILLEQTNDETHINPDHIEAMIVGTDGVTLYFTSGLEIEITREAFVALLTDMDARERRKA